MLLGGKLGRHPRLGRELAEVCDREEVLAIAERYLDRLVSQSGPIKRFGELVSEGFLERRSASGSRLVQAFRSDAAEHETCRSWLEPYNSLAQCIRISTLVNASLVAVPSSGC